MREGGEGGKEKEGEERKGGRGKRREIFVSINKRA